MKRWSKAIVSGTLLAGLARPGAAQRRIFGPEIPAEERIEDASPDPFPLDDLGIKFDMEALKKQIRGHEGVVPYPYPDPEGQVALIGMGFNLNKAAILRTEGDPADPFQYNGRVRREPSSAELWDMAGVSVPFEQIMQAVEIERHAGKKDRVKITPKDPKKRPHITPEDAEKLFTISVCQAVNNAAAYFDHFKTMTPYQQMAASEWTYQLGTNLEQFVVTMNYANREEPDWEGMRRAMRQSQWYRKYNHRGADIVAMFDPVYQPKHAPAVKHVQTLQYRNKTPSGHGR